MVFEGGARAQLAQLTNAEFDSGKAFLESGGGVALIHETAQNVLLHLGLGGAFVG